MRFLQQLHPELSLTQIMLCTCGASMDTEIELSIATEIVWRPIMPYDSEASGKAESTL